MFKSIYKLTEKEYLSNKNYYLDLFFNTENHNYFFNYFQSNTYSRKNIYLNYQILNDGFDYILKNKDFIPNINKNFYKYISFFLSFVFTINEEEEEKYLSFYLYPYIKTIFNCTKLKNNYYFNAEILIVNFTNKLINFVLEDKYYLNKFFNDFSLYYATSNSDLKFNIAPFEDNLENIKNPYFQSPEGKNILKNLQSNLIKIYNQQILLINKHYKNIPLKNILEKDILKYRDFLLPVFNHFFIMNVFSFLPYHSNYYIKDIFNKFLIDLSKNYINNNSKTKKYKINTFINKEYLNKENYNLELNENQIFVLFLFITYNYHSFMLKKRINKKIFTEIAILINNKLVKNSDLENRVRNVLLRNNNIIILTFLDYLKNVKKCNFNKIILITNLLKNIIQLKRLNKQNYNIAINNNKFILDFILNNKDKLKKDIERLKVKNHINIDVIFSEENDKIYFINKFYQNNINLFNIEKELFSSLYEHNKVIIDHNNISNNINVAVKNNNIPKIKLNKL